MGDKIVAGDGLFVLQKILHVRVNDTSWLVRLEPSLNGWPGVGAEQEDRDANGSQRKCKQWMVPNKKERGYR